MTPRSLWTILLKIFGLLILSDALTVIPASLSSIYMTAHSITHDYVGASFLSAVIVLLAMSLYVGAIWFFLFRSQLVIDKLGLDKHFQEERFDLNIKSSTAVQIAVIILGGLNLAYAIPLFCYQAFQFYQETSVFKESPTSAWMVMYFVETVIGYLIITNSGHLTAWIEKTENADTNSAELE